MDFCQSGGHNSGQTSRITGNLTTMQHMDKNNTSLWKICDRCVKKYAKADPTMDILLFWANEISSTNVDAKTKVRILVCDLFESLPTGSLLKHSLNFATTKEAYCQIIQSGCCRLFWKLLGSYYNVFFHLRDELSQLLYLGIGKQFF